MAAVYTGTSGWWAWKLRRPSGAASRQTKRIERGRVSFSRSTAATAELPVASMGSSTMASRSGMPCGTLK